VAIANTQMCYILIGWYRISGRKHGVEDKSAFVLGGGVAAKETSEDLTALFGTLEDSVWTNGFSFSIRPGLATPRRWVLVFYEKIWSKGGCALAGERRGEGRGEGRGRWGSAAATATAAAPEGGQPSQATE
jgi:hypothetical protein